MSSPIEEIIANLGSSDKPLRSSKLAGLSNLNSEELAVLEQVWATIEPKRRRQIVSQLVRLAEDDFELNFDSILKNCLKDEDAEVRSKAIEGLWENEEPSLINPLINLLEQDSSEKVQAAAATALGKFVMLAEHKKLNSSHVAKVCSALLAVISDKSKPIEVKRRALEAVAPINLPQVKRAILQAYRSHDPKIRCSSIYAMGKSCNPAWLPTLLKELGSADTEIRYEAAGACGELGEEEAVPHLTALVNGPDIEVQLAAIQALGKIGGTEAKNCLEQCLDDDSEAIQQAAEQAIHELELGEEPLSF
jgi:HEAT repeat protein